MDDRTNGETYNRTDTRQSTLARGSTYNMGVHDEYGKKPSYVHKCMVLGHQAEVSDEEMEIVDTDEPTVIRTITVNIGHS